ncbi:MAG TPA: ribonuclease III [Reyranella sp.]|jgi:ribonuclease-3|nr:ribonuclease III [Reyranella sp.]
MARGYPLQPLLHGDPLRPGDVDLDGLAGRIGHAFARAELALEALTHRSALDRRPDLKQAFPYGNERLEFLGDRVLSLAMSKQLLLRFPQEGEGHIARRHAVLVSAKVLGEIAGEIGLANFLIGDRGKQPPTATILADALEALLGAVFLDAGFDAAARLIERLWGERLESKEIADRPAKSQLQEWAQGRGLALPYYRQVSRSGSEHEPLFVVEVTVGKYPPAQGQGPTKREAESAAARALLDQVGRT